MNMTGLSNAELRRFMDYSARPELAEAARQETARRLTSGEFYHRIGRRHMGNDRRNQ